MIKYYIIGLFSFAIIVSLIFNYQVIVINNESDRIIYNVKLVAAEQDMPVDSVLSIGESRIVQTPGKFYTNSYSLRYSEIFQVDTIHHRFDLFSIDGIEPKLLWKGGNYLTFTFTNDSIIFNSWIK